MDFRLSLILVFLLIAGGFVLAPDEFRASKGNEAAVVNSEVVDDAPQIPSLEILPQEVIQGDPVAVILKNIEFSDVSSLTFNGKKAGVFEEGGELMAFIGIDLRMNTGSYPLVLNLKNGEKIESQLVVGKKKAPQEVFGIPEKLGGNTPEAVEALGSSLIEESRLIASIPTALKKLWQGKFRYPLDPPIEVTDDYGYTRITGQATFSHKGTDFRAQIGTPVYAINSGLVRYVGFLRNYGNTVVVDHGFGLQSIYMHLSEVLVKEGENVERGTLLGKSGDTGYVLGPHLHLSLKIDQISIDPMKFLEMFGN